jgi:hypothetical protein
VDEESLLNGLLLLSTLLNVLASTFCGTTKHKLGLELPLLGNVPVTLCLLVNDRVVVLEVASAAFSLKSSPEVVLGHGGRLSSPTREMVSIQSKLGLKLSDRLGINKEQNLICQQRSASVSSVVCFSVTYSTMTSLETIKFLLSLGELLFRHLRLQHFLDKLPELLVFVIEQNNKTGGCRIETVRDVKNVVSSQLLNASVGNGDFVGQLVDGSAVFAGAEEVHGRCHCCCFGRAVEVFCWKDGGR